MKKIFSNSEGFTFLEILVAVTLTSLILIMTYQAQSQYIKKISKSTKEADYINHITLTFKTIDSDLTSLYLPAKAENAPVKSDVVSQQPIKEGEALSMRVIDRNEVFPVSNASLNDANTNIVNVSYFIKSVDDSFDLLRRVSLDTDPEKTYHTETVLLHKLKFFKAEFFADKSWVEKWDTSEKKKNPDGIRLTLEFTNNKGADEKYVILGYPGMKGK